MLQKLKDRVAHTAFDLLDVFDDAIAGKREFEKPDGTKLVIGERASNGLMLLGGLISIFGQHGDEDDAED
jgi:hypothetical protein